MIDQTGLNANFVASRLEEIISTVTVELMNYGGTTPPQTYDMLVEDFPDLCKLFDRDHLIARCKGIQQAELPDESKRLHELFQAYNHSYFGGRLPSYTVRVVYDVNFWADQYFSNGHFLEPPSYGYHDQRRRTIFLRNGDFPIEAVLVHEMAHAATTDEHDGEWLEEMRRLQALGAPVSPWEFENALPPDGREQLELVRVNRDDIMG